MRRCGVLVAGILVGVAWSAARAEELDAAKVRSLSVEQAGNVTFRGEGMRFAALTDLSPEVAAVLAKREARLEFPLLENPTPAVLEALAANTAGVSFPKLATLTPEMARILAGSKSRSVTLGGLKEISPEAAAALAEYTGYLELGVTSLTSIPLAHKLGSQQTLRLGVPTLSDEIARALFLSPLARGPQHMYLGLKELSVEGAKALGERGRTLGGHWQFNELEALPDEVAEALSAPAAIRCLKVTALSDRAARALNRYTHAHMYALADVSNESLEMFSKRGGFMIHGLRKLDCVPFAATLMSQNSDFLDLPHLETISAEAADALAADARRSKRGVVPLPALTALSSVALAEVLADGTIGHPSSAKRPLSLPRLATAPDAVVRALAKRESPLHLGLEPVSVEAAKALAARPGDTLLNTTRLSDEAAAALAGGQGKIQLPKLAEVSAAGLAALRGNPMIELPKSIGQAR